MPKDPNLWSGVGERSPARPPVSLCLPTLGLAALMLAGCVGAGGKDVASRNSLNPDTPGSALEETVSPKEGGSPLIAELLARSSVLPAGGSFATVADAVLTADAGAAAAELRIARLRAEAREKNWLPKLGPSVSLTSLNGLAAGLILQQAVFDHGRRKAERAYAAADVEVAAVTLSTDINQRVFEGLTHHVKAERARAQGGVAAKATERLAGFADVMRQRVEGGLSDRSEQQVIDQHLTQMQATLSNDREAALTAEADLAAMASAEAVSVRGIDRLGVVGNSTEPLAVVKTRGEGARSIAEAKMARADLLPGITAQADITGQGIDPGLKMGGSGLLGFGTKEEFAALEATADVVGRRSTEAMETANRRIVSLERQIAALEARQAQGASVLSQTESNMELFVEQYKLGRRSMLELVGQYDTYARMERDQVSLRYEIALLELEIARDRGLLVDGARM
jgi:outer membrane protein, adhesin transport system